MKYHYFVSYAIMGERIGFGSAGIVYSSPISRSEDIRVLEKELSAGKSGPIIILNWQRFEEEDSE